MGHVPASSWFWEDSQIFRRDKGLNAIHIFRESQVASQKGIFIAIVHKSLHSGSWSSASSDDFQEHLPIWWKIWCHQNPSQWWLTAHCCCWVFAESSSSFWQSPQPGTRSQAALGNTARRGASFWHVSCFYLLSLASCSSLLEPETFTRTCFENHWTRHTPSPAILRFLQRRSIMKVMKNGACPLFIF